MLALKRGTTPQLPASALAAAQPSLHDLHLPRPLATLAKLHNLPRIDDGNALAALAIHPQHIIVAAIVADSVQALAAHGLRRINQTRAEIAVTNAANPINAPESRMNIATPKS